MAANPRIYHVLNHTNFVPSATQIDNPTFGVLSAPQSAENVRKPTGQLALRASSSRVMRAITVATEGNANLD
jgi:hypothetical protein